MLPKINIDSTPEVVFFKFANVFVTEMVYINLENIRQNIACERKLYIISEISI